MPHLVLVRHTGNRFPGTLGLSNAYARQWPSTGSCTRDIDPLADFTKLRPHRVGSVDQALSASIHAKRGWQAYATR